METLLAVLLFLYVVVAAALTIHGTTELGWGRRLVVAIFWPVWTVAALLWWKD